MAGWRLAGDPGGVPAHLPAGWPVRQNGAGDGICGKRIVRWQPATWHLAGGWAPAGWIRQAHWISPVFLWKIWKFGAH
jgi:hypothetical protein